MYIIIQCLFKKAKENTCDFTYDISLRKKNVILLKKCPAKVSELIFPIIILDSGTHKSFYFNPSNHSGSCYTWNKEIFRW